MTGWVPSALCGELPVSTLARGFHFYEEIMVLLPDERGLILVELFINAVAFFRNVFFAAALCSHRREFVYSALHSYLCSTRFFPCIIFRPSLGVSIAGLPMLGYAYARLHEKFSYKYMAVMALYALSFRSGSSIFYVELVLLSVLIYYAIVRKEFDVRTVGVLVGFNLLALVADFRLVYDHLINSSFETNRTAFSAESSLGVVKNLILSIKKEISKVGPVVVVVSFGGLLAALLRGYRWKLMIGCVVLELMIFSEMLNTTGIPGIHLNTNMTWATLGLTLLIFALSLEGLCSLFAVRTAKLFFDRGRCSSFGVFCYKIRV